MGLGMPRVRNYGKDAQQVALALTLEQKRVAFKVRGDNLLLAGSAHGQTLPFETVATLVNTRRGRWEARHIFDDRRLAVGVSQRDVIRATIGAIWH